jgi:hypothetical protein
MKSQEELLAEPLFAATTHRARRALKGPSPVEVVEQALAEVIANREIGAALKRLIRRGRGHFANLDKAST